jgi:phytanoyl-CoA hydroxylase
MTTRLAPVETSSASPSTKLDSLASPKNENSPEGYFRGPLDQAGKAFYDDHGYIVLDRALSDREVDALVDETTRVCRNADGRIAGIGPAPAGLSDEEILREILCIHFPHKLSEIMHQALFQPAVVQALTTVIGPDVKCMQSMLFVKASGKPGQAWHQDEDYIPTRDRSLLGAWIALDDATVENGCLWIIPGSHKPGVLWEQEWHGDERFDCALESRRFPYTDDDAVPVEVKRGTVVFFNGYTLHRSLPNRARSGFRRALVNHYMSAGSLLPWKAEENKSIATSDYRDIVLIAGNDPYAWKGVEDIAKPGVRSTGKGGCFDWNTKEPLHYAGKEV